MREPIVLRPLLDTALDRQRYVERDLDERLIALLRAGRNVLVSGTRGSGRTSMAFHAIGHLDHRAIVLPVGLARKPQDVLHQLLAALATDEQADDPAVAEGLLHAGETVRALRALEARNDEIDGRVLVVVDDIDPIVGFELFGRLRNELWLLDRIHWLVLCLDHDMPMLTRPPADAFFDARLSIGPLSYEEARRVLRARQLDEPEQLEWIAEEDRMPVTVLRAVSEPVRRDTLSDPLPVPAADLLAWLRAHGPHAISDAALLRGTRLSRTAATRAAASLRETGLIREVTAPPTGRPGRPKRFYEAVGA